ncbi:MAG TPA: Gfo/Idh/MocA family oxidoreductase, partial [Planctomycetota bacterium]|nr:Gfo/Idh/MocA family oxidoreductase [Planctomycetota bacterium]
HWAYRRDSMPGGALLEGGIHLIDICNYLLGRPIAVNAVLRRRITPGESEDSCAILCRYQAPGDTSEGYFSDIPVSILCSTSAPSTNLIRVSGSRANAVISDRQTELVLEQADGQRSPCLIPTPFDAFQTLSSRRQELDEFAYCIRTGMAPETDGICGLKALAVVEAAILANGKGGEVFIDELGLAF